MSLMRLFLAIRNSSLPLSFRKEITRGDWKSSTQTVLYSRSSELYGRGTSEEEDALELQVLEGEGGPG